MRDTVQQGAITQALIENQGQIEVRSHTIAAAGYRSQAAQARQQEKAHKFGGFFNIALGILGLFSDKSLKHNIVKVGVSEKGENIYEFSYIGSDDRWRGFIAQELDPNDVTDAAGVLGVDTAHRAERIS